jgi:hypothetical protein
VWLRLAIAELKLYSSERNDSRETLRPSFQSFLRTTPSSLPMRAISLLNAMLSQDFSAPGLSKSLGKTGFLGRSVQAIPKDIRTNLDESEFEQRAQSFSART